MKYNGQSYTTALFKLLACSILMLCTSLMSFAQSSTSNTTTWTGNTDANWETIANWSNGVPNEDKDVIIPTGCTTYPVCNENSICRNIYIASGARLGNQHLLTYTQAFVDVTIPTNRYVRLIPPLRETYSGDFFTKEQGGAWSELTPASYQPTEGTSGPNRAKPGATYQSLFSEATTEVDAYQNYTVASVQTGWTSPKNALNTKYKALQGIDVWVDNNNTTTATFHFPSIEEEYDYFDLNGKQQAFGEEVPRSEESGKFVYDENTSDNDGNYNLNYWREAGSTNPMFCVGNPAMAYLNVKEFLKGNSNNITPFIYLHNEVYGGRGTETILYYNNAEETLHQVQADYTGNEDEDIPSKSGTPLDNYYILPTQGFRVIAGGTVLHAVEPRLIGSTTIKYTEVRDAQRKILIWTTHKKSANLSTTISIALDPSDPYKVELSNLVQLGNVEAIINPEQGTITIPNGTPIRFIDDTWKRNKNEEYDGSKTLYIYGCTSTSASTSGQAVLSDYHKFVSDNYQVKYATNLGGADVVFKYKKNPDGSIEIEQQNAFVVYTDDMYEAIIKGERPNLYYKSQDDCLAWYVYEGISSTKNNSLGDAFILPEAEGVYESYINAKTDNQNSLTDIKPGEYYGNITIHRINGTTNQVLISGLYPGETSNVIGTISENNGTYTLTIPAGQIVKQTDKNDPSKNWHLYVKDRVSNIILTWDNAKRWSCDKQAQISRQNANPSSSSPGFYLSSTFDDNFGLERTGNLTDESNQAISEIHKSQNNNFLTLQFTPDMFVTNPSNPAQAPQRTNKQSNSKASSLVTITAHGNQTYGSTLLVKQTKARAAYSAMEDAPLADINKQSFCIASLAGEQVVGVNVFDNMDIIPLFLQGDAQALSLQFNNIEALNYEAELYDAVEENSTPITPGNCSIDIQLYGDQAAGRFFIRKKESVTPPNDATDLSSTNTDWTAHAWCPAPGTLVITSGLTNKVGNIRLFNLAGQELINTTCKDIHTIKSLSSGIYIVEVSKNNEVKTLKVQVK